MHVYVFLVSFLFKNSTLFMLTQINKSFVKEVLHRKSGKFLGGNILISSAWHVGWSNLMEIKGPQEPITPGVRLKRTLNKGFALSRGV